MRTRDEMLRADAAALLAAARDADDPAPADRARIDAAMAVTLGAHGIAAPAPAGSPAGTAAGAARGSSAGLTGKLALALAGVGALGAVWVLTRAPAEPAAAVPAPAKVAPAARAQVATPARPAPVPEAKAPKAKAPEPQPTPEPDTAFRTARRVRAARSVHEQLASAGPAPTPETLRAELALLQQADTALRAQRYADALRVLDTHAQRFAQGALAEERRGLRVLALCGLGETERGRAEQQQFLHSTPHSVLAERVRDACPLAAAAGADSRGH